MIKLKDSPQLTFVVDGYIFLLISWETIYEK